MTVNELNELGVDLTFNEDGELYGEIESDGVLQDVGDAISGDLDIDDIEEEENEETNLNLGDNDLVI